MSQASDLQSTSTHSHRASCRPSLPSPLSNVSPIPNYVVSPPSPTSFPSFAVPQSTHPSSPRAPERAGGRFAPHSLHRSLHPLSPHTSYGLTGTFYSAYSILATLHAFSQDSFPRHLTPSPRTQRGAPPPLSVPATSFPRAYMTKRLAK
ncbi:hypothetical protein C8J57DRAFT_1517266 [Mycena rebaudengoi]|nr:hypothetical protein C8J57DRAFT_1517266 [Mycena rebaudengoi]